MTPSVNDPSASPIALWSPALARVESRRNYQIALALLVAAATVAGAVLRLWNLGRLGLVVDEGFMALAVDGVLKHGLPILDHGFAYTRSLLFIYMQSACALLVGNGPLALRLPAAIFGIACIPVAYALGRQTLGRTVGAVLAVLLAFSVWEIELSRYGRFYTLLQLMWMLSLISFHRGFIEDRRWARLWFFVVVLVGLWVHTLMIFAGALFMMVLPLRGYSWRRRLADMGILFTFIPLRVFTDQMIKLVQVMVRDSGVVMPSGHFGTAHAAGLHVVSEQAITPLYTPNFEVLEMVAQSQPTWLAILAAIGAIGLIVVALGLRRGEGWRPCLLAAAAIVCGVTDQLGLVVVLAIVYAIFFVRRWSDLRRWHVLAAAATMVPCAALWFWFTWSVQLVPARNAISRLFEFPNFDRYFLQWMINGWPVMTLGLVVGLVVIAARAGRSDRANTAWFTVMAFLLPLLLSCVIKSKWIEARYFFHLYPQVVMIFATTPVLVVAWLARTMRLHHPVPLAALAVVALGATLVFSQDGNPLKSVRIPHRAYNQPRDPIKSVVSWALQRAYHQDHEGVAQYVRQHLQPDDVVVVVGPQHNAAIYKFLLGRVDYVFCDPEDYTRVMIDMNDRQIDDVADAVVLSDIDELRGVIESPHSGVVWLISDTMLSNPDYWVLHDYAGADRSYLQDIFANPSYTARDGRQTVQRVGDALVVNGG